MASAQPSPTEEDIAKLAYHLWEERGGPIGSPEVDWARAEKELAAARAEVAVAVALAGQRGRTGKSRSSAPTGRAQRASVQARRPDRRGSI
jgi:hypothetical protein